MILFMPMGIDINHKKFQVDSFTPSYPEMSIKSQKCLVKAKSENNFFDVFFFEILFFSVLLVVHIQLN